VRDKVIINNKYERIERQRWQLFGINAIHAGNAVDASCYSGPRSFVKRTRREASLESWLGPDHESCVFQSAVSRSRRSIFQVPSQIKEAWEISMQNYPWILQIDFPSQFDLIYERTFCALHPRRWRNMPNVSHSDDPRGSCGVFYGRADHAVSTEQTGAQIRQILSVDRTLKFAFVAMFAEWSSNGNPLD